MGVIVETSAGAVAGIDQGAHQAFLGLPYARPPTGERRWLPPEPAEVWQGVRPASSFGNAAAQPDHPVLGFAASGTRSEDCLYLNVYTPRADGAQRPVMLWIHGGGFTHGSSGEALYDGGALAERGDLVVVTINYRLGALGYLAPPGPTEQGPTEQGPTEQGPTEPGIVPNVGQLDQVAALSWVRDEIFRFGGDPGQVTLFGQSAGASAVSALLAMPPARGLFRRAIMQSGGGGEPAPLEEGASAARLLARLLARELGVEPADAGALRALPVESLLGAQAALTGRARFGPVLDGEAIGAATPELAAGGALSEIPIMLGTNRDEMKQFRRMQARPPQSDEELLWEVREAMPRGREFWAERVIGVVRSSRQARQLPAQNLDAGDLVAGARMRAGSTRLAELSGRHQSAFLYLFDWESPARRGDLGSCHSLEMPFVFGTLDAPMQDRFAGSGPAAERLSSQMMDAWLAFARSDNSSHEGIGRWPSYEPRSWPTIIFGPSSGVTEAPLEEERALFWELCYG